MRVSIGDVSLFFDVEGPKLVPAGSWMVERPTLVLLHPGPGFDHTVYKLETGTLLSEFVQVVYLDMRGHGRSDSSPAEELTLERWADDVHDFCATLSIERPIVLGHGFGAIVAAAYGIRHPEHPAKLVLVNPAARVVDDWAVEAYTRLGGVEAGEVVRRFRENPGEETFARFLRVCFPLVTNYERSAELSVRADWNPTVMMHWFRRIAPGIDLRSGLAGIQAPTFVLAGEDDPELTLAAAVEVRDSLPAELVRFKSYPGARHAVFRVATEAFNDVKDFILDGEPTA